MIVAPAESHLNSDRNIDGVDDSRDHVYGRLGVAHQSGTTASSVDACHGATHVDIDTLIVAGFQPFGCSDQIVRDPAEDLNA